MSGREISTLRREERNSSPVIDAKIELPRLAEIVRAQVRGGMILAYLFLLGGLVWSSMAPMAEGAIAPGIISPDGSRRTVQHLEGGIIQQLKVSEGDMVHVGDPLVVLQPTQAGAVYELLREQERTLAATLARLTAEKDGDPTIAFPQDILAEGDARGRAIVASQEALFDQRRSSLDAQLRVIDARKRQLEEQVSALESQIGSVDIQLALIAREYGAKKTLIDKGLLTRPEGLKLERARAALDGERGSYLGQIAEAREKVSELDSQIFSLKATQAAEVAKDMETARASYIDVAERLGASKDVLDRTVIVSPVNGKIANLRFKTSGGVIGAGQPILDIVPTDEQLLIDARIAPADIDVVTPDLSATVHLTAYSGRELPRVNGIVRTVSADRVTDEATGQSYYLARVEVPQQELAKLEKGIVMKPGMPAEVLIVTGERTVLTYLMEPLKAAFRRGFREV